MTVKNEPRPLISSPLKRVLEGMRTSLKKKIIMQGGSQTESIEADVHLICMQFLVPKNFKHLEYKVLACGK